MKYLLRERMRENQSLLWHCKQFLGKALLPKPPGEAFELEDFVGGLSPETQMKLHRVQGQLKAEWASATSIPLTPVQGRPSRWVRTAETTVAVSRPKIRVQISRMEHEKSEPEKPTTEVRGLDDIFPERITGFFEDSKPKPVKSTGSAVIHYKVVDPTLRKTSTKPDKQEQATIVFDDTLRQKVRWPMASKAKPPVYPAAKAPEWVETRTAEKPAPKPSLTTLLWSSLHAKLSSALAKVEPIIEACQEEITRQPEMLPAGLEARAPRLVELPARELPKPVRRERSLPLHNASEMATATGMDIRALSRSGNSIKESLTPPEKAPETEISQAQPAVPLVQETPQPSLDATLMISKRRKPFSSPAAETKPSQKPVADLPDLTLSPDLSPVDYMWRNNKILARSISNLADQYFQQAALEEHVNFS